MPWITDPAFAQLLRDALAYGHQAAAAAGHASALDAAEHVIDVAEQEAFEQFEAHAGRAPEPMSDRLTILRDIAAILYASEQELLVKVDALEERVHALRATMDTFANLRSPRDGAPDVFNLDDVMYEARGALNTDDAAAHDAEPVTSKEPR